MAFHQCTAPYPLFGGAVGGGKSHAGRWDFHMRCLAVPLFRGLILRRNLPDLRRTHARDCAIEANQLGARWAANANGAGEVHYPNGSLMELGHCQHEHDVAIYLSAEYDAIFFDELVTFTEYQYQMLRTRCRTTKPGVQPRVSAGSNPGGAQSLWVKRRWITRDITLDEDPEYKESDYAFIPSKLSDNPYLNSFEYEKTLRALPPELRRAYLEGDWDVFLGQFFSEFRKDTHVREYTAPGHLTRTCGLDWGFANEGVCLWGVILPDGQLLIEDEYVFNGPRKNKQIASEVATEIARRNKERGIRVRATFADPAMFAPMGHVGETLAQTFAKHGVPLTEANNDRIHGWSKLRAWMRPMPKAAAEPDERPWMVIHPRCGFIIRTLPQLVMDENQPEDCDTDGPDHAADALRYLCAGRPAPTPDVVQELPEGCAGWLKQQILSAGRYAPLGARNVRPRRYAY
jgi:phage terminase large subunit